MGCLSGKFIYFSNSNNIKGIFMVFIVIEKGQVDRTDQNVSLIVTSILVSYEHSSSFALLSSPLLVTFPSAFSPSIPLLSNLWSLN